MQGKKKKKKAQFGAQLNEGIPGQQAGFSQWAGLGQVAGGMVDMVDQPNAMGVRSTGGAIASGALKGAAMGATFGPWGAAIGGAIGGLSSAFGNKKAKEKASLLDAQQKAAITRDAANYANRLKFGGKIGKQKLINGGELNPISPDAVEVDADNPNQTDSVELTDAFVDHNEIIDNKNRVFSDSIKTPSGRTVAQEAKRLEKMKNDSIRFTPSNNRINQQLDTLFQYQAQNQPMPEVDYETLDKINKSIAERTAQREASYNATRERWAREDAYKKEHRYDHLMKKFDKYNKAESDATKLQSIKPRFQYGGDTDPKPPLMAAAGTGGTGFNFDMPWKPSTKYQEYGMTWDTDPNAVTIPFRRQENKPFMDPVDTSPLKPEMQLSGYIPDMVPSSTPATVSSMPAMGAQTGAAGGNKVNWGKVGNLAATFGSNVLNQFLIGKMKGPASPRLEREIQLGRVSARPQLAEISSAFRDANNALQRGTAQTSTLLSGTGNLMAKKLQATNQVYGDVNRQNTEIGNQEAMANAGIRARNNNAQNIFSQSKIDFENMKKRMTSQNVANASEKVMSMTRERNQMDRDMLEMNILGEAYKDSGVKQRAIDKYLDEYFQKKGIKRK